MKKILTIIIFFYSISFGQISINSFTFTYSPDFNSLASSGTGNTWTDNETISGWYSTRTNYNAGTGSSNTGALYSFGSTGSSERALGSVASGSTGSIHYGIRLVNNSGSVITRIPLRYTGEQWRNGGNTAQHSLIFSYQIAATNLTTGTWIEVTSLNFTGPIATSTAGALDGNVFENRIILNATIDLTLSVGQEIWFRWTDVDDPGNDHGLAVDDFEFNPGGGSLPVELSSFTAKVLMSGGVQLNWRTETEVNNYGFEVQRAEGNFEFRNSPEGMDGQNFELIGFVEGNGNSNSPKEYTFTDDLTPNLSRTLYYRLKQIDTDGQFEYSKVIEVDAGNIPDGFVLEQNYPNPFNPTTNIRFRIADFGFVTLKVYDVLGNEIAILVNEEKQPGTYEVKFTVGQDSSPDIASGIYFYQLATESKTESRKMLLIK